MGNFNRDNNSGPRRDFGRRDFGRRDFGGHGGRREMYKAVCGKCGKDCEVPFEPRDGRPVYCSECFEKKDGGSQAPRTFQDRGPRNPNFERKDGPRTQSDGKLEAIDHKLDRILEMLSTIRLKEEKETVAKPEEVMFVDQKKAKTSKKKVTAPKK